jgi:thiamine-phosphate pyrophosphorylase
MKFIVLSSPDQFQTEIGTITKLFSEGLHTFHVRKPKWSADKMSEYLEMIPAKFRSRIIIHSHHKLATKYKLLGIHLTKKHLHRGWKNRIRLARYKLKNPKLQVTRSCHQLSELTEDDYKYAYVFLTPMFAGISKRSHSGGFGDRAVKATLIECPHQVIALGGVQPSTIKKVQELGFDGAAMLGCIWGTSGKEVEVFKHALDIALADSPKTEAPISIQVAS